METSTAPYEAPRITSLPAAPLHRPQPPAPPAPAGAGPALTVSRVPHREPGGAMAPVIRLQPRKDHPVCPAAGVQPAEVTDIARAEETRRVAAVAKSVGQAVIEVLGGVRPVNQLSRWLDPLSYERLALRSALVREQRDRHKLRPGAAVHRLHRRPQIHSVHLCALGPNAYEAALVVAEQNRARALALRLEYRQELWKVTALEVG